MRHEQVGEHVDHVGGLQFAGDPDGQARAGELVDDVEHADLAAIVRAVFNEVVGPHVIAMLGPEPDAGAVVEPEAPRFGLRDPSAGVCRLAETGLDVMGR